MAYRKPVPISDKHVLTEFSSGQRTLDNWLKDTARYNKEQGFSSTFVIADENFRVVGYHAMCGGMIHRSDIPRSLKGSRAPTEIPVAVLARLAVSQNHQGKGLGASLMRNALLSVVSAARVVAFRGVVVHAIDHDAVKFYRRYAFRETTGMERRLILPVADIVASLAKASG